MMDFFRLPLWTDEGAREAAVISEDKELTFQGWVGPKDAAKLIKAGEKAFRGNAKS